MKLTGLTNRQGAKRTFVSGITLLEVVLSITIVATVFCGIVGGYIHSAYKAEWSGYSLAAQALSIQQLEQAKSALWDGSQTKNELTNIVRVTAEMLDIPVSGTNFVWATNRADLAFKTNSASGATWCMVKVDTVWPFRWKSKVTYFTNTVACYFAPDTPDK